MAKRRRSSKGSEAWKWILGGVAGVAAIGGLVWYEEQKAQNNAMAPGAAGTPATPTTTTAAAGG
jgi:hypothetical protein